MEGRVCHRWHSNEGIWYAHLLPNGNLLLRTGPAVEEASFLSRPERELLPRGGRTVAGAILELDWDSNVVWEVPVSLPAPRFRAAAQRQYPGAYLGTHARRSDAAGQRRIRVRRRSSRYDGRYDAGGHARRGGGLRMELMGAPGLVGRPHLFPRRPRTGLYAKFRESVKTR